MFRSACLVALIFSVTLDVSSAVGVAANAGADTSVAADTSAIFSPVIERRAMSEPSVLLLVGFALLTAARAARR